MIYIIFLIQSLCITSYKINRLTKDSDITKLKYIGTKDKYKFYIHKDKEVYVDISLPQQVSKLMNMEEIKIEKNNITYLIKPFEYFKMIKDKETQNLGFFNKLKFEQNSVVCYYTGGNICQKSKIMFVLSNDIPKIEKFFSGESSFLVYKVSGTFIGEKCDCHVIHYLTDEDFNKSELRKVNVDQKNLTPSFLNLLSKNLKDNHFYEEKRDEL